MVRSACKIDLSRLDSGALHLSKAMRNVGDDLARRLGLGE